MKIVVASDSFKGCLSSAEVADTVEEGLMLLKPTPEVIKLEVADGGEGTADVIGRTCHGKRVNATTVTSSGYPVTSRYWIINDSTAVIDVASSCGLTLEGEGTDILKRSTFGFGMVIADAFKRGCRKFIIGLGGSATCDGGLGMLKGIGVRCSPEMTKGEDIAKAMQDLIALEILPGAREIMQCDFTILSDVTNPLFGPNGASEVYGPQKGATSLQVGLLDEGLRNLAKVGKKLTGKDLSSDPGAGAAGGLGWAFMTFFNSKIVRGAEGVLDIVGFDKVIEDADLVITGEGKMDRQTLCGKLPLMVCRRTEQFGVPTVALAGSISDCEELLDAGFAGVFPIISRPMTLREAMDRNNARKMIRDTAASVAHLLGL